MSYCRSDIDWAEALLQGFDRARSLTVWLLLVNNEWEQLVHLNCNPSEYLDFNQLDFRKDYQATELFRKVEDIAIPGVDPKSAALNSFYAAEKQCFNTNQRIYKYILAESSVLHYGTDPKIASFISRWKKEISVILGKIPHQLDVKFSSGSTFDDRRFILPMDKMSSRPTSTAGAWDVIHDSWRHTLWSRSLCQERPDSSSPKLVLGNRFTTVPKTALTHRGICVEPSLNVTHQLSVGAVIRKRLRQDGIDLKFGQSSHQSMVAWASLTKEYATIDLSSASDTVAYNLVKLLLPGSWFDLLDALRSPMTKVNGEWHKNAKFSSMGNGYTFELETLIFYTLAKTIAIDRSVPFSTILTYGDDIIVPTSLAKPVLNALEFFGFTPNKRKTYTGDVPFRESCGADYFNGVNVRGHYLHEIPSTPQQWIALANGIRRMAQHDITSYSDLGSYWPAWLRIINHIPAADRNFGPLHFGDLVICTDDSTWWRTRTRNGYHELRVTYPVYSDASYSHVDRQCWSRGSIISAAVLGHLKNAGLQHKNTTKGTKCFPVKFLKPRSSVSGWKHKFIPYGLNSNYPRWICQPEFGF